MRKRQETTDNPATAPEAGEEPSRTDGPAEAGGQGRAAQRRRTRTAILEAATRLIAAGQSPSVDDIAAAADVSRRTVYMYFPTLDQLLLDATLGALSATTVDAALGPDLEDIQDAGARIDALVQTLSRMAPISLPLGRRIIQLTIDAPPPAAGDMRPSQRRGYRRVEWVERAVSPLRETLSSEQFERLVSALSFTVGWEAMIVLRDVCGLSEQREEEVLRWAAASLVQAMLAEAEGVLSEGEH